MMSLSQCLRGLIISSVLMVAACQSSSAVTYAALESTDNETMAALKSVLAGAMNTATVELGPGDLTQTSIITVLPPRLSTNEDRSTVRPTQFDIIIKGATCFVVRRDTNDEYELKGVACRALNR